MVGLYFTTTNLTIFLAQTIGSRFEPVTVTLTLRRNSFIQTSEILKIGLRHVSELRRFKINVCLMDFMTSEPLRTNHGHRLERL